MTFDGAETDLDLGHYERFLDTELTQASSLMSGRVLGNVIAGEREGKYLGQTVQIIPHVTNAIQTEILRAGAGHDVHIVEIGGTVGDYESLSFIEAIRELGQRIGRDNTLFVHLVYLPYLGASKEVKTKPAQNATRELRSLGIVPDVIVARSESPTPVSVKRKLSLFSGVEERAIALLPNARSVYEVPLTLEKSGLGRYMVERLHLKQAKKPNLRSWRYVVSRATKPPARTVKVGVVAKYMDNEDTYMSVFEALRAAGFKHNVGVDIHWIEAESLKQGNLKRRLKGMHGIVVPGGFGKRGLEGKIAAADYALKYKIPYLGLCLGLQMAVVAVARQAGLKSANTIELEPATSDPVIHIMPGQQRLWGTGGTMRLGNYKCKLLAGSLARRLYARSEVSERHRHRYEVNNAYREILQNAGIIFSGVSPDDRLVEIIEHAKHPFFLASQFHPELKSRPNRPHPMFDGFIGALPKRRK